MTTKQLIALATTAVAVALSSIVAPIAATAAPPATSAAKITSREGGERRERDEASSMQTNYGLPADTTALTFAP